MTDLCSTALATNTLSIVGIRFCIRVHECLKVQQSPRELHSFSNVVNCGHISSIPNCYFEFIISYFLFTFTSGRLITCSHDHEAVSAESSLHLNVSGVHLFVQRVAPVGDERCHFFFFFLLNRTGPYQSGCQERAGSLKPDIDRRHVFLLLLFVRPQNEEAARL